MFAAKYAERNFLFSNVIGAEQQDPVQPRPAERVEAVAPWLTTDTSVYPAIVNKRMVWIVDGYTTLDNYPYSELTSLSTATADSTEVALNRLAPDKQVSYIRNSVKATVDAYDGTVTLYAQDETGPGAEGVDEGVPRHGQARRATSRPTCRRTCATPRTCSRCSARCWPSTTSTTR